MEVSLENCSWKLSFACDVCAANNENKVNSKSHMKIVYEDTFSPCDKCDFDSNKFFFKMHKKTFHGVLTENLEKTVSKVYSF